MTNNPVDDSTTKSDDNSLERRSFLQLAALAGVSAAAVNEVKAGSPGQDPDRDRDGEIVIGLSDSGGDLQGRAKQLTPDGAEVVDVNETLGFVVVSLPKGADAAGEVNTLASRADVRYAEENGKKRALFHPSPAERSLDEDTAGSEGEDGADAVTPDDTYFSYQYAPQQVKAPEAWEKTTGSPDVTIAVVDTGTKYDHEDLAANMDDSVANHGYDFVDNDSDPYPEDFSSGGEAEDHGTHVSGIAGAVTDNGMGVAGISDCSLLAVRVLGTDGRGWHSDIASGIQWAADNGADVINLSLGSDGESSTIGDALEYAYNAGVFIVASAGNDAEEKTSYGPASQPQCMAVSSVDDNEDLSSFSNYGDYVEITAPGSSVLSTYPADLNDGGASDEYAYMSGTSMSAPVVAGVAGLTLSRLDWLSNDELRAHLKNTADDIGLTATEQGAGQVNAASSVSVPDHDHLGDTWSGNSPTNHGLRVDAGNTRYGLFGTTSADNGWALLGRATSSSGSTIGAFGRSDSSEGSGVYGIASADSGDTYGVRGRADSPTGDGVYGLATSPTGVAVGVRGQAHSPQGFGLWGVGRDGADGLYGRAYGGGPDGNATGVLARSDAPEGRGVVGFTTSSSGSNTGVYGRSESSEGVGVRGWAMSSSGETVGVLGAASSPDGYGVYSDGDMHVDGDFSASGTKNFVQTVTTDDGPKAIAYTAVEADTAHTETSGVAELESGRAEIHLPYHFGLVTAETEAITVQVTPYSTDANGPAVTHRSTDRIVVEDPDADSDYEFAYTVRGTRAGYEDEPVVSKPSEPISPDGPSIPDDS